MMTCIYKNGSKYRIITKGAPEVVLNSCNRLKNENEIEKLDNTKREKLLQKNNRMANDALRVLAVAFCDVEELPKQINSNTIENNLIFVRINWND